jgi:mannose-1-phosphate guanylyltransferase
VLYQPIDRGTAPAAFLALCEIAWRDPEATVVLYPANHFLSPEEASVDLVASAVRLSAELPERPVLLGVRPEGWETENGWVQPSTMVPSWSAGNGVRARDVVRFIAKPTMETAAELAREQALWSTGILVGRLATLWRLGWRYLPEIMLPWLYAGTDRPGETLEDVYLEMPVRDLSRDLLQYAASNLVVMEAKDLHWSAWEYLSILQRTLAGLERNENRTRDDSQIDTRPQSPGT